MGRIFKPTRPLLDEQGQPVIGPDGKLVRVPRTNLYYLRVYDANGKARDIATGTDKITEARKMLHAEEAKKDKGEPIGAQVGKITFDDAVKAVIDDQKMNARRSTTREQGRIDSHLTPYFGGRRMISITSDVITAYVVARQQADAENGTVNRELQILKRAFKLAQRAGKLLSAPYIPKLQESEPRQGFFERAEFEAVCHQLPAHLRGLLTFYYWTGWRSSEALSLERRQVNLDTSIVTLDPSQSKNNTARQFHFGALDELRDMLKKQVKSAERQTRRTGKMVTTVFYNPDGSPIKKSEWRKAWEAAREAAGYPTKLVHDFRRTAARNLVRAGVAETVAMKLTGHKTRSMFDRYNITSGDDLRAAAELLQAFATGSPKDNKPRASIRQFKKSVASRVIRG
jgi:integrase